MTYEELAVILGVKKKWYEEKRDREEWFLGYRDLVVSGTNGWSDRECVWFHDGKALHFLEPFLIDGLYVIWNEVHREESDDEDAFDVWLKTMEGHAEIEEGLYVLLDSAEQNARDGVADRQLYVEE